MTALNDAINGLVGIANVDPDGGFAEIIRAATCLGVRVAYENREQLEEVYLEAEKMAWEGLQRSMAVIESQCIGKENMN